MLTDLWHEHSPSIGARQYAVLRERCRAFAEALQTVNILKDVARDAEHENSIYIPEQLLRAHGSAHDTILASDRVAREPRGARDAGAARLAGSRSGDGVPAHDSAPRRVDPAVLRAAAAVRLRHAARSHAQARARSRGASVVKISRSEVKSLTALSVLGVFSNRVLARLVDAHADEAGRRRLVAIAA